MHSSLDFTLLLVAVVLIFLDAIFTKIGLEKGLTERNLILRWVLSKFGPAGLAATRIVAVGLLFLLFSLLDQQEWLLFSLIFSSVMVYVLVTDIKKTH